LKVSQKVPDDKINSPKNFILKGNKNEEIKHSEESKDV
jgi:hypothetical protein